MEKPKILNEAGLEQIRDYTVRGLAESVPEVINMAQAEELLCLWFPGDTLALEALYRRINAGKTNGTAPNRKRR
jgi:hypothetical protein